MPQIEQFVAGLTDRSIGDGQAAAFAMAVFFRGMDIDERVALTRAMSQSGTTMHWDRADLHGPVVDKHSTGGVGDKVSLMLAPLVAAVRRPRADDLGSRPRPQRRHVRQAREHPRLPGHP